MVDITKDLETVDSEPEEDVTPLDEKLLREGLQLSRFYERIIQLKDVCVRVKIISGVLLEFELERRIKMNIEKKSNRFCWKIENFGLYFLTQTEPMESPPFEIAGVGSNVYFRLALFKEIHKKEVRVACYLNVTEWSRPPAKMRLDGTVTLKMPKGNINFVLQRAAIPKLVGSTLLIGTTTGSDTMFPESDFANYSISILFNLWRSPVFGSRHCSAVTRIEKQIKKYVATLKPSFPFSLIVLSKSCEGTSEEFIWEQMNSKTDPIGIFLKEKEHNARIKCILTLENKSNIPRIRKEIIHVIDDREETIWWIVNDFFPSDILDEKDPLHFKNDSPVCVRIELNITFYKELGSIQKYFSDSHTETSKELRHCLKSNLKTFFRSCRKGCDLILRCENEDFLVHKSLLCCKSTVFRLMFESDMKEKKFGIVEMEGTDFLTVSRFIEYLYLGSVTDSILDLDSAMALYAIAHRYSILDLVNYSRKFLVFNTDCGDSHEMLQFADLKGKNAVQARKKLTDVYGEGVLTVRQCQNWFAKFRSGNFDVEDAPRSGRPVEADKDAIKAGRRAVLLARCDRSECAIRNCWEQWTREGTLAQKTGSGATRKTTRREDRKNVRSTCGPHSDLFNDTSRRRDSNCSTNNFQTPCRSKS
ncbi:histone-lysine N-methyltransferase SETMAR [Trichonephila clavipes]|nr:histone-lysine N-methyltransferase SETMAR [Trichonephila clavipes]